MQLTRPTYQKPEEVTTSVGSMFFDGASTQASASAGTVLFSPLKETIHFSYKLDFKTNNNIVEYEAFFVGNEGFQGNGNHVPEDLWRCKSHHTVGEQYFSSKECQAEGIQR